MIAPPPEAEVLAKLAGWVDSTPSVRAALLYSSRADPTACLDIFSDYDILLAVADIHPFHANPAWLAGYGLPLVVFRNPIGVENGFESFAFITHYQDGVKIDYSLYPLAYFDWLGRQARLPADLDYGFRVLVDKDRLCDRLPAPTYSAYLLQPPTPAEFLAVVEEFFNDALYVGKNLWRGNLFGVKLSLDQIMKFTCLRKLLEWQAAMETGWQARLGAAGKGLQRRVDPARWSELKRTYVGAGVEENWQALFATLQLFRQVAIEVAGGLGYVYPEQIDRGVTERLQEIRAMKPPGDTL
jgi:aminoglycoside 6-adenylyltransferase